MDYQELKSHLEELEVNEKRKLGGLEMARECVDSNDFNLMENALESFDADDLVVQLIRAITLDSTGDDKDDAIGFVIREFSRSLNAHYRESIVDRISEVAAEIEDLEEFGEPGSKDYEFKRNGFDSERGFHKYING